MSVIDKSPGVRLSDYTEDTEILVHTHYSSSRRCGVTLFTDKDEDDGPFECSMCRFRAYYDKPDSDGFDYYYFSLEEGTYICAVCDFDSEVERDVQIHWAEEHGD